MLLHREYTVIGGVLYDKDVTTLLAYPKEHTQTVYQVPTTVTELDLLMLEGATNIEKIKYGAVTE